MVSHYSEDGILFLQTQNVKPFFIDLAHSVRIDRDFHEQLPKSMVRKGNVLLARSGSFGTASIYLDEDVVNAADIIIVDLDRNGGISPLYLVAFMNSKYGVGQLLRFASGGLQGHVNLRILESFKIPLLETKLQDEIGKIVTDAYKARQKSAAAYDAACALLSSALKENELKFDHPLSYTTRFSDVMREGRADADFFQVPFMQMQEHLDKLKSAPLSSLVDFVKGVEVGSNSYAENGKLFMRVSNLTEHGMKSNASDKLIPDDLYRSLAGAFQPKQGELLLTKDGTPGISWVVDRPIECIVSGAIVRLLPKKSDVPPEYLALAINATLCRMQVEQQASGALILHWKLPLIKKLRIPLCDKDTMKEIARLVKESKRQQYKSESLLAAAKSRVEELIEAAAK